MLKKRWCGGGAIPVTRARLSWPPCRPAKAAPHQAPHKTQQTSKPTRTRTRTDTKDRENDRNKERERGLDGILRCEAGGTHCCMRAPHTPHATMPHTTLDNTAYIRGNMDALGNQHRRMVCTTTCSRPDRLPATFCHHKSSALALATFPRLHQN